MKSLVFGILLLAGVALVPMIEAELGFVKEISDRGDNSNQLETPTDIVVAVDGGTVRLYVADSQNHRINVFDDKGDQKSSYGKFCDTEKLGECDDDKGEGEFNNPIGIATAEKGSKFYVLDAGNERIQVFGSDFKYQQDIGSTDENDDHYLKDPRGIAVKGLKDIFVTDAESDSIIAFESEAFKYKFNTLDTKSEKLKDPTRMTISGNMIYVSDSGNNRVAIFEIRDDCENGTIRSVDGICFVKKFGSDGTGKGEFKDPAGLAYDSKNKLLYVADSGDNSIQVFKMDDKGCAFENKIIDGVCFVQEFGSSGGGDGKFDTPTGLSLDTKNNLLYVVDTENHRIQALTTTGDTTSSVSSGTLKAPKNLKVVAHSVTSLVLTWDEPVHGDDVEIKGYKIEYREGTGDYEIVTLDTKSTATSIVHDGLSKKNIYHYKVYAISAEKTSSASSSASGQPERVNTPTGLIAKAISPTQVELAWQAPTDTTAGMVTSYVIYPDAVKSQEVADASSTTRKVTGLKTDKAYTYFVAGKSQYGETNLSEGVTVTPREDSSGSLGIIKVIKVGDNLPTPPIKLEAASASSTSIKLTWGKPADDKGAEITGYKIEVKRADGVYKTVQKDTKKTDLTYTHTDLETDTKYTYKVSAINSIGTSEASNEANATPVVPKLEISPIRDLTIDEGKEIKFTARLVNDAISNPIFSLGGAPPQGATMTKQGEFSWTPTMDVGGKTYKFKVNAKKDAMSDSVDVSIKVNDSIKDEPAKTPPKEPPKEQPKPEPVEKKIEVPATFVDETADPQSYVDRYNTEPEYKKWFDENYAEYDSIYHAVGLDEPTEEELAVPAEFVEDDPQSYVDRYNTEPEYKKWFDENYAEYDSIYHAVGLDEPTEEPPKEEPVIKSGFCGKGTKLVDGICIAEKLIKKPWWQFW